jgi:undecaprenyl-diphosphatase
MEFVLLLKAFVLGIVEGITEFLPISSTGHLIIAGDGLDFNDDRGKVFMIVIQLGAILAVCWEYRQKIGGVVLGLKSEAAAQHFTLNLLVAFMPAVVLGLLFHDVITTYLMRPFTVAVALIVGGVIILLIEHFYNRHHHIEHVEDMGWRDALKLGFAQTLALFPGVSRAGATIMGGVLFGLSRHAATEFSFFLAIPTMIGATTLDVYKSWHFLSAADLPMFIVGFIVAFGSALLAVRGLLRYIAHHSFIAFAWYRIIFGAVVLWYFWDKGWMPTEPI